jgi:hypothetical protein
MGSRVFAFIKAETSIRDALSRGVGLIPAITSVTFPRRIAVARGCEIVTMSLTLQ